MGNTSAFEVIDSFESTFADKQVLPESLELEWLLKAIARYSIELDPLKYDVELNEFDSVLDRYVIDTLAQMMKESYQERQVSLANKRISIVGKDLSIDGGGHNKTSERYHLDYVSAKAQDMIENQKPSAYS